MLRQFPPVKAIDVAKYSASESGEEQRVIPEGSASYGRTRLHMRIDLVQLVCRYGHVCIAGGTNVITQLFAVAISQPRWRLV